MCRRGGGARASWGRARSVEGRERLDAAGLAAEIGPLTIPDRITPSDAAEHQTAHPQRAPERDQRGPPLREAIPA